MSTQKTKIEPTITEMISLEIPWWKMSISPDGNKVAYAVQTPNWNKNFNSDDCFIYDRKTNKTFQLVRSASIKNLKWLDNDSLVLLKVNPEEKENKPQVYIYENLIGEPWQVTDHKTGVMNFKLFAEGILFVATNPDKEESKERTNKFGKIVHFEQEESKKALYYVNFKKMKEYQQKIKNSTEDEAKKLVNPILEISLLLPEPISISSFDSSKQNDKIFLNCRLKDDLVYLRETSIYQITLNAKKALETFIKKQEEKQDQKEESSDKTEEKKDDYSYIGNIIKLALPKNTSVYEISPDGKKILIRYQIRDDMFYTQSDIGLLDISKNNSLLNDETLFKKVINITANLDQIPMEVCWVESGIFVIYVEGTKTKIIKISETGEIQNLNLDNLVPDPTFQISENGHILISAFTNKKRFELYLSKSIPLIDKIEFIQITNFSEKLKNWSLGSVETIRWKSKDGTEIEGILRKPANFDPKKKYPLVFIIHGGPTWYNAENILEYNDMLYYPSVQFSNKGMLVLKVNYRGSIGRGQAFLELNKNNLGIGDLWDIESAIDYLDGQGFLDTERIGCMGWSQGGYISAYVSTHSKRFKAVSVGAGVSDWYTYHISNDIPDFTTDYLSGSPFKDKTLYEKTAPISKIKEAKTPTLIQHGEVDQRVPISNAKELYRGLKEMGVPVELFIYPGMGHPITKPRENRAIMHQNLNWFSHYLLGEELDLLQNKGE